MLNLCKVIKYLIFKRRKISLKDSTERILDRFLHVFRHAAIIASHLLLKPVEIKAVSGEMSII